MSAAVPGSGIVLQFDASQLRTLAGRFASFNQMLGQNVQEAIEERIGPAILEQLIDATPISDRDKAVHAYQQWQIRSISVFGVGSAGISIVNSSEYLPYVITGRQGGTIIHGNPFLAFEVGGEKVVTRFVEQGAMQPNDFITPVFQSAERLILHEVNASVKITMDSLAI